MRGGGPQDISEKPVDRGKPLKEPQGSFMTQPTGLTFTSWHPNTSFFKLTEKQEFGPVSSPASRGLGAEVKSHTRRIHYTKLNQ